MAEVLVAAPRCVSCNRLFVPEEGGLDFGWKWSPRERWGLGYCAACLAALRARQLRPIEELLREALGTG